MTYTIDGTEYNWWQKLIYGPDGELYFWVAIGCAAAIGALFLAVAIALIVYCCKRKNQVGSEEKTPGY